MTPSFQNRVFSVEEMAAIKIQACFRGHLVLYSLTITFLLLFALPLVFANSNLLLWCICHIFKRSLILTDKVHYIESYDILPTCMLVVQARRAFHALRSLVKLQALARGVCARRQARIALQFMHALVRLQVRVRARQLLNRYSEESDRWSFLQMTSLVPSKLTREVSFTSANASYKTCNKPIYLFANTVANCIQNPIFVCLWTVWLLFCNLFGCLFLLVLNALIFPLSCYFSSVLQLVLEVFCFSEILLRCTSRIQVPNFLFAVRNLLRTGYQFSSLFSSPLTHNMDRLNYRILKLRTQLYNL